MQNKWWKKPTRMERLKFLWAHPDAINDAFIVLATMICMAILGLCMMLL